jgi:glycosyltransferase involved in cell wall biosynthesis
VINEGMSSACAVCASREMGAAPFLIQDGVNGYLFRYSDMETLYDRVKGLLQDPEQRKQMARAAADTINNEWNGENAAHKFVELCKKIQTGDELFTYSEGVCSRAEIDIKK